MSVKQFFLLPLILFAGSFNLFATVPNCEIFVGSYNTGTIYNEQFIIRFPKGTNIETETITIDKQEKDYDSKLKISSNGGEGQSKPLDMFFKRMRLRANQQALELKIFSPGAFEGFMDGCDSCSNRNSYKDADVLKGLRTVKKIVKELQDKKICEVKPVPCLIESKDIESSPGIRYELRLRNIYTNPLYLHRSKNLSTALDILNNSKICKSTSDNQG